MMYYCECLKGTSWELGAVAKLGPHFGIVTTSIVTIKPCSDFFSVIRRGPALFVPLFGGL
jgi:hypothetical protein